VKTTTIRRGTSPNSSGTTSAVLPSTSREPDGALDQSLRGIHHKKEPAHKEDNRNDQGHNWTMMPLARGGTRMRAGILIPCED